MFKILKFRIHLSNRAKATAHPLFLPFGLNGNTRAFTALIITAIAPNGRTRGRLSSRDTMRSSSRGKHRDERLGIGRCQSNCGRNAAASTKVSQLQKQSAFALSSLSETYARLPRAGSSAQPSTSHRDDTVTQAILHVTQFSGC